MNQSESPNVAPSVVETLTDDEAALYAILQDPSGLDQAEFLWHSQENPDGCFRAWPFQWAWWRSVDGKQIDQCARSVGKSMSIKVRGCAFPFVHPGQEMVVTAPELVHLEPIVNLIESQFYATRFYREMLPRGRSAVTHRPFQMNFLNGARIIGRIPQRDGKGVKGCQTGDGLVMTDRGLVRADEIKVGDLVVTHKGRLRPVTGVYEDGNDCYEVRGQGSFPMTVSCDHRFYGAENQADSRHKRVMLPLGWHDVETLTDHQVYWASPTSFPELPIPGLVYNGTAKPLEQDSKHFWWLVGRYLADGYLSHNAQTGKEKRVHWVVHADKKAALLSAIEMIGGRARVVERTHSSADAVQLCSAPLHDWLLQHFGELSDGKQIAAFVLGAEAGIRGPLLDGYLAGDGHRNLNKKRWEAGSASKKLAVGIQLLAQTFGHQVNVTIARPKPFGAIKTTKPSYRVHIYDRGCGRAVRQEGHILGKVKEVVSVGKQTVYDIRVEEDHSYLSGSIVSHNIHPIWLELDEAQDYPEAGWTELTETLQRGKEGAVWRAHGVTRGVRDKFYEYTQDTPDNDWKVHRYPAMYRPNWSDDERKAKETEYGGKDDADYRRNVLGLHGDNTNPLFVLASLMKCVDSDETTTYNTVEYFNPGWGASKRTPNRVSSDNLNLFSQDITELLDYPPAHLTTYRKDGPTPGVFWVGMDIGYTIDPSEILIWVEYRKKKSDQKTCIKLIGRVCLVRMPHPEQVKAILHTIDFYRPKAFAMDKGGNGLPLFQAIQGALKAIREGRNHEVPPWMLAYDLDECLETMKGYNFSERLLVDVDESIEVDQFDDPLLKAGMRRNAKEYGSDALRDLVDSQRLEMPWDAEMLKQFSGATWSNAKGLSDLYGRRIFSKGNDHTLDASRFMALGHAQHSIEEMIASRDKHEPILDLW